MSDCADCKGLKRQDLLERSRLCEVPESFEPLDISFCPHQMTWLIQNIQILHQFRWVGDIQFKHPLRKKLVGRGYFETPADFAFEVERRLWHCRRDGLITMLHYGYDFTIEELAKFIDLSQKAIKYRCEVVIWHISGWNFYPEYAYRWDNVSRNYRTWESRQK